MSDFDYRNGDNYGDDSIHESDIRIENTPMTTDQASRGRDSYQEDGRYYYSDSQTDDDRYYYDDAHQESNGAYYDHAHQESSGPYYDDNHYEQQAGRYHYDNHSQTDRKTGSGYDYIPEEPQPRTKKVKKKTKKKSSWFSGAVKAASYALIFGLVAGAAFAGVNTAKDHFFPSTSSQIETTTSEPEKEDALNKDTTTENKSAAAALPEDATAVVDKVMPSVVSITGTYRTENYFGFGSQESQGAGSGFLIAEKDGKLYLATNNHVVENASSLTVGFVDDTTAPATVVGKDSNCDVAVISVDKKDISDETAKKIKIATLGDSDNLKLGQPVIVIGNALGYGQSVTYGVISAKDREVSFADGTMSLLQTDAAINPGNSGGVMINLNGEVVGISNAKLEDTSIEGMCYAIPITTAKVIMTDLMNAGEISADEASYLGIVGKNIDANYSEALGMPKGIYVSQVVSGSPAEEAGIMAGDIITAMNGANVSTMAGLKEKLSIKKAGTKVEITVKRANQNGEYEEKTLKVKLGKASDFQDATSNNQSQDNQSQDPNGGQGNGNNGNPGNGFGGNSGNGFDDSDNYFDNGNGNGNGNGNYDPFYYFFN